MDRPAGSHPYVQRENMKDIWREHAERLRRQEQLERFDRWCLEHPVQSWFLSIGIALLIFEVSQLLRFTLDALGR
jgi:hypothetical protein